MRSASPQFCPQMLLKPLHHLGRGALGVGALRWAAVSLGYPMLGSWVGLLIEPAAYVTSAYLVWQMARKPESSHAQQLLAPAFIIIALVETASASWMLLGNEYPAALLAAVWTPIAMLTVGIQVTAAGHRGRALRRALEAESAEARRALEHSERRRSVRAERRPWASI